MQHIEFFHQDHFEKNYHRHYPLGRLSLFIDFFWQTEFDHLWKKHPQGFSDVLFPNIGYTYLVNLGTPFVMQVEENKTEMKGDGFLPRLNHIECYHQTGNCIFGIKFKVSPVIFEKKVNFSEYSGTVFPLSYLLEQPVITGIKMASSFEKRVALLCKHYEQILVQYEGSLQPIEIVTSILADCLKQNKFDLSVEELAGKYLISTRTLQRYFETATGISSKKALQILRIRKAVSHIITAPETFHYGIYGYYDFSHFYKHLKKFFQKDTLLHLQPHLQLLQTLHKREGR